MTSYSKNNEDMFDSSKFHYHLELYLITKSIKVEWDIFR